MTIGTRGSELALWQANFIKGRLEEVASRPVSLKIIKTQGDRAGDLSFDKMEGKGFFTREIEDALLSDEIDLAVHSLKDLQTTMPPGLVLAAVGFREDNREAAVIRKEAFDDGRPLNIRPGATVGSSSVRRQCQIAHYRPDLRLVDLRGNVPTRVRRLREGRVDAIIVAWAGIKRLRLDLADLEIVLFDQSVFFPAPGQGILAVQTRASDAEINEIVSCLDDPLVRRQAFLERGVLARFEGGCRLPLGVYSEIDGATMRLHAVLGRRDGDRWSGLVRADAAGDDAAGLIEEVYIRLSSQPGGAGGADED